MDEQFENGIFSDIQRQQLSQGYFFSPLPQLSNPRASYDHIYIPCINLQQSSHQMQKQYEDGNINKICSPKAYQFQNYIKAYNPMQMIQKMPQSKRLQYLRIAHNTKNFNGLQFFFSTQDHDQQSNQNIFLSGINQQLFDNNQNNSNNLNLNKLFIQNQYETQIENIQKMMNNLKIKINQSQQKHFNSIMINKTIGMAFYQHFDNFTFVSNPTNFIHDLENNLNNFIHNAKRIKGPGIQLIYSIYDFWMKSFKDFVNQIWKYSQKYTLNFFKKQKNSQKSQKSQKSSVSDYSCSQTKNNQQKQSKQKRKNWTNDQIRVLQKIIDSNLIFGQNKLKQLAQSLGRSVNSISSKIQKILKSKKGQQCHQDSLLKKTIQVLKLHRDGLNKDLVLQKISQYYQMGYDGQWQKSVGQLLSSRKQFNKIKGKYKLININQNNNQISMKNTKMIEEDNQKITFRDKVIKCFMKFQNYQTDLKSLVQIYLQLFGSQQIVQNDLQQRKKSIEASISKALSRYDIFDTSNSKTIYQLNQINEI